MKRIILLLTIFVSVIYADTNRYFIKKNINTQEKYFIKIAAFKNIQNAKNLQLKIDFSTKIIFMKEYYSLVSRGYDRRDEAKKAYFKIRKIYKDAYIFKLYQKVDKREPKIAKPRVVKIKHNQLEKEIQTPKKDDRAIKLYNLKRYEEALMAFDMLLIENPENLDAKLYYARTLYKLALFNEAKNEFKQLLKLPITADNKKEILYYLEEIEKKHKRNFFHAVVGLGVGFDDNINLSPDAKTTQYGAFKLINDTNKTTSTYGSASLALSHLYKGDLFSIYSSLYSYNEFAHTAKGNNINYLDLSTSFLKKFGNFSLATPIGFNISYLDGEEIAQNIYTNPSLTYTINRNTKTFVEASYLNNSTKFAENRDYIAVGGGMGIRYKNNKLQTLFSIHKQNNKAIKNVRYDISKNCMNYFISGKYYLLKDFYIGSDFRYKSSDFTRVDDVLGYKKEDKLSSYSIFAGKIIKKNFLVDLRFQQTKNDSNINTYSYKKNSYKCNAKYKF